MSNPRGPEWSDPTRAGYGYPPNTDPAYSGQYPSGQYWGPTAIRTRLRRPDDAAHRTVAARLADRPGIPGGTTSTTTAAEVTALAVDRRRRCRASGRRPGAGAGDRQQQLQGVDGGGSARDDPDDPEHREQSSDDHDDPDAATHNHHACATTGSHDLRAADRAGEPSDSETATPSPTGTETVVYTVSGEGRAINITYVDTGGVMQTEFNVTLPWSKEVSLSAPAKNSASVAVVNVGRDVTCSVSVNGAQVRQRTGRGLTICTGAGLAAARSGTRTSSIPTSPAASDQQNAGQPGAVGVEHVDEDEEQPRARGTPTARPVMV